MAGPNDTDAELDAALSPAGPPPLARPAAAASHERVPEKGDAELDNAMTAMGNISAADEKKTGPNPAIVHQAAQTIHGPTRFQQAPPASMTDRDKWAATPWSDVGGQALQNAVPSAWGAVKSIGHAIAPWNWKEDASAIGQLAKGAASKFGAFDQSPEQKGKNEAVINALMDHYKDVYGTIGGFKKALATDPASIAMDASTFADGVGVLGKAADLPKLANAASKVSSATNPILGAVKIAKGIGAAPVGIARKVSGALTGVSPDFLKKAAIAGASSDPELRAAYLRHFAGTGPTDEPITAMTQAFNTMKQQTLAQLRADKKLTYANTPGSMPFNDIDAALANAKTGLNPGGIPSPAAWHSSTKSALQDAENFVSYAKANPALQTMEGFDQLRDRIGHLLNVDKNDSHLQHTIGNIYGAVRGTMQKVSPEYTDVLERTSQAQNDLKDMQRTMGVNSAAMTPVLLARQMRAMVTARGRDMMGKISQIDPRIPYMLAGIATHELAPHGLRHVAQGVGAAGGAAAIMANPAAWVPIAGGAAGAFAASSPKISGALNYGYGALDRVAKSPLTKGAYFTGRADDELTNPQQPMVNAGATTLGTTLTRNVRNNNPGDIADAPKDKFAKSQPGYVGNDGKLARFDTMENGTAATKNLIRRVIAEGRDTPSAFVDRWVPEGDNSPEARASYKKQLASALKIGPNDPMPRSEDAVEAAFHAIARAEGADVRSTRASGGRTGIDHAAEAGKLIRRAEQTKKTLGKATEPLLQASDDHIAKALAMANESI